MTSNHYAPEAGITDISKSNATALLKDHGLPEMIVLIPQGQQQRILCTWPGHTFTFTGFTWGYRGTGPHGTLWFLHQLGRTALTIDDIAHMDQTVATVLHLGIDYGPGSPYAKKCC